MTVPPSNGPAGLRPTAAMVMLNPMAITSTRKPRVLLLHNFLTPYRIPLFAELARRVNLDVWILGDVRAIRKWQNPDADPGFRWRLLPNRSLSLGSRDYRLVWNPGIRKALETARPDVLLICGWDTPAAFQAAAWARRSRTPYVLWNGSTASEPNWRRTLAQGIVRWIVRGASAWTADGSRAKEYAVALGASAERTFISWFVADNDAFAKPAAQARANLDETRRKLGYPPQPGIVLFCGQLIRRKGVHDLLAGFRQAVAAGADAGLVYVGDGPMETWLRTHAAGWGLENRVRLIDFAEREALPSYYAAADLMALPSYQEPWGLVVNEALACGTPVLATEPVAAAADLVTHGQSGYIVPPGDPAAIAQALGVHFGPAADRSAMRVAAQEAVAPFTIERSAEAFSAAIAAARASHG